MDHLKIVRNSIIPGDGMDLFLISLSLVMLPGVASMALPVIVLIGQSPAWPMVLTNGAQAGPQRISEGDAPSFRRKGSGFLTPEGQVGAADKEDVLDNWQ